MPKFETVKAGDVLYDVHRQKMGNTTMSRLGCWDVKVISVDAEAGTVLASWNGNPAQTYYRRSVEKWRRSKPKPKTGSMWGS
jgi:hypothetical protein